MSGPVVRIEGLGKCYRIGAQRERYLSLRDSVARQARRMVGLLRGVARVRPAYDELWALKDVTFSVAQGECVGIIGRNGAGKSTLLKVLSQITPPTEGRITCRGRIASLLEVGTGFHPELTGRENIFLNGAILGMTRAEIRGKFDEIVGFSELEKFLETPVKRYSSGMYVRLAFSVAAHLEPEILLVDEVLAVGDAAFQQRCMGRMSDVAKEGRTILFVSHNMGAMTALCKKGVWLDKGRVQASGLMSEVVRQYLSSVESDAEKRVFVRDKADEEEKLVKILSLKISSSRGAHSPVSGEPMLITLHYRAQREGLPIQFLVGVFDGFQTRVLALDSAVSSDLPPTFPGEGTVKVELPAEFSLHPGRYSVNMAACLHRETVDFIPEAAVFNVEEGDFYGTGRRAYGKSTVLVKASWTVV